MLELDSLSEETLEEVEHHFCQCVTRSRLWKRFGTKPNITPVGLCGPVLKEVVGKFRPELKGRQQELADLVGPSKTALNTFFNHAKASVKNVNYCWVAETRLLFRIVLLGTAWNQHYEQAEPRTSAARITERILLFFFGSDAEPVEANEVPFFHPDVVFTNAATSLIEVAAEWRWMAYNQRHGLSVRAVLVSGGEAIMVRPGGERSRTADEAFFDALAVGVEVYMCYPEKKRFPTEAETRAEELRAAVVEARGAAVARNLLLCPLHNRSALSEAGPNQRWPVEFLSPIFSFGYVSVGDSNNGKMSIWRPLVRHADGFRALPEAGEKERASFAEWQNLIIESFRSGGRRPGGRAATPRSTPQ